MADPRRHHFIPRFLLKGFAHRCAGKEVYVEVIRRDSTSFETNTRNVGQERDFHGESTTSSLEKQIALREGVFAPLVQRLQNGDLSESDYAGIRALVTHLSIRTKNLRDGMSAAAKAFLERVPAMLRQQDQRKAQLLMDKALRRELAAGQFGATMSRLLPRQRKLIRRIAEKKIKELDPRPIMAQMAEKISSVLDVEALSKGAHINALTKSDTPEARIALLTEFTFELRNSSSPRFVLGDVVVLCKFQNFQLPRSLANVLGPLDAIYLPLSPDYCLVGHGAGITPLLTANEINRASVELSRDFVVCGSSEDLPQEAIAHFGKRADLLTDEDLNEAFSDI